MRTLCDHPAWSNGHRLVRTPTGTVSATIEDDGITRSSPGPVIDIYEPAELSERVPELLRRGLQDRGTVARLRTPDLWEAVATAIIRQVIRADQARKMHQRFTDTHGEATASGSVFPLPEVVRDLSDEVFGELGMAFKRAPLRAAAQAMLDHSEKWQHLHPTDLVNELQSVPRIGPWTAGAAVADYTGDFSLYPYGDMAVRKWASTAAPDIDWPTDEPTFAAWWRSFALTPQQLSTLTVLTLALGGTPRGQDQPPA